MSETRSPQALAEPRRASVDRTRGPFFLDSERWDFAICADHAIAFSCPPVLQGSFFPIMTITRGPCRGVPRRANRRQSHIWYG